MVKIIKNIIKYKKLNFALTLLEQIDDFFIYEMFKKLMNNEKLMNSKYYERVLVLMAKETDVNAAIYVSNIVSNSDFLDDENYELGLELLENRTLEDETDIFSKIRFYIHYKKGLDKLIEYKNKLENKQKIMKYS